MLSVVSAPATPALTSADAKAHLRVSSDREDDTIARYIAAAAESFEGRTRRSLITRRYSLDLPAWPGADTWPEGPEARRLRRAVDDRDGQRLRLPRPPIQRLVSVAQVGADGSETPLSGLTLSAGAIARPASGWPSLPDGAYLRIVFEAGYGASDSTIPADVRQCLRMMVANSYYWRESGEAPAPAMMMDMNTARRYEARWSI